MEKRRGMNRTPAHKRPSIHTHVARRRVPAAAVLAVAVVLALAGFAAARYVMQQQQDGLATATDFYFTSDYLKESGENATYYIDPSTDDFTVELRNFADDLRTTSGGISYSVNATNASVASGSGMLKGTERSTAKVTVTPSSGVQEFTVTATSTSPYAQELTATFILANGNHYTVEDASGNTAAVLTMTCADSGGPITLDLPSEVIPDATDGRVRSENMFTADGPGVYSLVLLKTNASLNLTDSGEFANKITVGTSPAT